MQKKCSPLPSINPPRRDRISKNNIFQRIRASAAVLLLKTLFDLLRDTVYTIRRDPGTGTGRAVAFPEITTLRVIRITRMTVLYNIITSCPTFRDE